MSPSACSRASPSASSRTVWAWLISTIAHWGYGSAAGAAYGILAGSLRTPHPRYGLPFGVAVFAGDYVALPIAGLYKPIWEYDAKTVAWDLSAHLAYGAGTGTAFWLLTRIAWTTDYESKPNGLDRLEIRTPKRNG